MSTRTGFQLSLGSEEIDHWKNRLDVVYVGLPTQGGHFEQCFDIACRLFHD